MIPDDAYGIGDDIVDIKITAVDEWDNNYKSGENLNDIALLVGQSPYQCILSNYNDKYSYRDAQLSPFFTSAYLREHLYLNTLHPIEKKLSDISSEDLILMGNYTPSFWNICYLFLPAVSKEYMPKIEIQLTTFEGRKFRVIPTYTPPKE